MKIFFIVIGIILIIWGTFLIINSCLNYFMISDCDYFMIFIGIVNLWIGIWNLRTGVKW